MRSSNITILPLTEFIQARRHRVKDIAGMSLHAVYR